MRPGSLRVRLLIGAAVWVTVALVISGLALLYLFEGNFERRVRDDLTAIRNRLIAAISTDPGQDALDAALTDPLFATPLGGLYWQVENLDSGEILRSRSLWDTTLDYPQALLMSGPAFATFDGPEDQRLSAFGGIVTIGGSDNPARYLVTVAQDRAGIDRSMRQVGFEMTVALLILGLALFLAAWVQVHLGLSPLRKLAGGIESIRAGRAERLATDYPSEVLPLVSEVNELLAAREQSLKSARTRAGDLAHSLKTPIAVLFATASKLLAAGDTQNGETLADLSSEMTEQVDYQLRLAGIRPRTSATVLRASLNAAVLRTISVLRKTHEGEAIQWNASLGAEFEVDIDARDLLELLGIVLENAAKWARSTVSISTHERGGMIETIVEDDGPGLTNEQILDLGVRGHRLSEDRSGSGFGIAIAREITTTNGGTMSFKRGQLGGLSVTVTLPAA